MNKKSFLKNLLFLAGVVALAVTAVAPAHADYPQTKTTIYNASWQRVDLTHYRVTAVVYPHYATSIRVQFTASGRWGVEGQYVTRRSDGGLVYSAVIYAHPGNPLQSRSLVSDRPDDYSPITTLP